MKKENDEFLYKSDLKDIEDALLKEAEIAKQYLNDTVRDLSGIDRKYMIMSSIQTKTYKIPFRIRWQKFKNKFRNMF